MKIKICGMRRIEDIQMCNQYPIDYLGFIFYPKSFRYISKQQAIELTKHIQSAKTVGVFVNEEIETVIDLANSIPLDVIQLHGAENQEYINQLKDHTNARIWKAIRVKDESDLEKMNLLGVEHFLLDSFTSGYGGSGKTFNHELLRNVDISNIFIAGGINKDNIKGIMNYGPYGLDISSSIETDQYKDAQKLKEIMEELL